MDLTTHTPSTTRLLWIAGIALGSHLGVIIIRRLARRLIFSRLGSEAKAQTVTGFVQSIGMRFTALIGFSGERVFVPNRTIANVINYPCRPSEELGHQTALS